MKQRIVDISEGQTRNYMSGKVEILTLTIRTDRATFEVDYEKFKNCKVGDIIDVEVNLL